jgi:hypothetical protein
MVFVQQCTSRLLDGQTTMGLKQSENDGQGLPIEECSLRESQLFLRIVGLGECNRLAESKTPSRWDPAVPY